MRFRLAQLAWYDVPSQQGFPHQPTVIMSRPRAADRANSAPFFRNPSASLFAASIRARFDEVIPHACCATHAGGPHRHTSQYGVRRISLDER